MPNDITTIEIQRSAHREIKRIANRRGIKVKFVQDVLLAGWYMLTPDQQDIAYRAAFDPRRPKPASANAASA